MEWLVFFFSFSDHVICLVNVVVDPLCSIINDYFSNLYLVLKVFCLEPMYLFPLGFCVVYVIVASQKIQLLSFPVLEAFPHSSREAVAYYVNNSIR